MRPLDISSHACGNQNRYFLAKPFIFFTLTQWFLYLNLTRAQAKRWKLDLKKRKVWIYLWFCRNKLRQQLFWVLCCNYDDIHIDMGCWHGHHFSSRSKSCLFWTHILWEVPHIRVKALRVSLYSGSCAMWNHLISCRSHQVQQNSSRRHICLSN